MEQNRSNLIIGVILILAGGIFLLAQVTGLVDLGSTWPMVIIGVGAIFFIGMVMGGKSTAALAIPGSIIVTVGLILLVQNITGWWESWSYAWALIVAAVGIGITIAGAWGDDAAMRKNGLEVAKTGLILFVVFGAIMQIIFYFTGISTIGNLLFWSALLAVVGVFQLLTRLYRLVFTPDKVKRDDKDLFGPIFLTGIGSLGILYSLGWIDSTDILRIVNLWPLLLIAAGLQLVVGRRTAWLSAIIGILLVAGMIFTAFAGEQVGIEPFSMNINNTSITFGSGEKVVGSGVMVEKTVPIDAVTRVDLQAIGRLEIIQGENEGLVVQAEDNLMEYIITEVNGDQLRLGVQPKFILSPKKEIVYTLTIKDLEYMEVSGAATANIPTLETDDLTVQVSGASNCTIDSLTAVTLRVEVSGASHAQISGTVDELQADVSGASSLKAGDLESREANVDASGAGNVTVWVTDDLNADASGAASINYYGDPDVREDTSGAASVRKSGIK